MNAHGRTDGGERFQVLERGYDTRGGEYSATVRYGAHVAQVSINPVRGAWHMSGHVTHSGYCFQERTYTRRADAMRAMPRYVARSLADLETKHGEKALYATCMHEQCSRLAPDGLKCGAHGGEYTPREQAAEAFRVEALATHARLKARSQERRRLRDIHGECMILPRGCADNPACEHHAAVCEFYSIPTGARGGAS